MGAVRDYGSIVLVLVFLSVSGVLVAEERLDFEARVAAQAAIERVYHSHRIDAPSDALETR